ncbi:type II toxin-antitoxin system Phd/YefM family antitoxin [Caedibacter taeniospiralis]|uniref:type II toxin-antitoxin system Phd/YefM family antitoxin n=1 Tax=Caedibacter taeniospiralis TaxID=28907 RepID=UPI000C279619|nr:type II toxin-antitoxin system prevent-host-death family antitoxin [Caedibacter taeniospiralis]
MHTVNYSNFGNQLAASMDKVVMDHQPMIVTRGSDKSAVVVMSLEDFKSYEETAYLMSSYVNASRLNAAIKEINNQQVQRHGIIEE